MKMYKYKNIMLEKLQKQTRKINALIRQNQIRRIKVIMLVCLCVFNSVSSVFAIQNENITYGDYTILCFKDPNKYISYMGKPQTNYEYYYIKDGIEYSAYCLELGKKGAEEKEEGYVVNVNEKINDNVLNNVILNCYPYKTIEELGLKTQSQARFASQFAVWAYVYGLELQYIEPLNDSYVCVVNAIKKIYNDGLSQNNNNIELNDEVSEQFVKDIENNKYYIKTLNLTRANNILEMNVFCSDKNVKILNNNGKYDICIPVEKVNDKYSVNLKISIKAKENAALFGVSTLDGYQNIALTLKNEFATSVNKSIDFNNTQSQVTIIKKDKDTNEALKGVAFSISLDAKNYEDYFTDEEGKITYKLYNNSKQKIYIKEKNNLENYKENNKIYEIEISPNDYKEIEIFNEKKKGKIKVVKKTKEYNEITKIDENMPLSDVSFYIYDQNMNIVDNLETDEKGIACTKDIPLGKYYIKEYKTKDGYKLLDELIEVNIGKDNEIVLVDILNENIDINNTLPITGM